MKQLGTAALVSQQNSRNPGRKRSSARSSFNHGRMSDTPRKETQSGSETSTLLLFQFKLFFYKQKNLPKPYQFRIHSKSFVILKSFFPKSSNSLAKSISKHPKLPNSFPNPLHNPIFENHPHDSLYKNRSTHKGEKVRPIQITSSGQATSSIISTTSRFSSIQVSLFQIARRVY